MTTMMTTRETTTDSSFGSDRWRPRCGAAIALVLLLAACSSTGESTTTASGPATIPSTTTITAPATTTTASPPDPGELLTGALDRYADGYRFRATTTVNDQQASVQTGRWLNGASEITVESGDGVVEYVIAADGQWVRLPGGEWEEIDTAPSVEYPLESMDAPESLNLLTWSGGTASVIAVYAAAAVGLTGDPVEVVLDFQDGYLVGVSFAADLAGNITESATSFEPLTDVTPITAPTS